jgi:hypothetical protein
MDNKYKNGKIYTIRYRNDDALIYVGSTVVPLCKRWSQHKTDSKKGKNENRQLYIKMNETDINDWYIELYEDCSYERREQLLQREGQVIREIGTLNMIISGRTNKEWFEENKTHVKEYKKEYHKEYKEDNKEYIKEKILCECGCSIYRNNIARHKQTRNHLDIMKELAKTQEQTI